MKKNAKRKTVKLKKHNIWVTVLLFFIMATALFVLMAEAIFSVVHIVLGSKISVAIDTVDKMAYELKDTDPEELYKRYGKDLFITDSDGNILYKYGMNTCITEKGVKYITSETEDTRYILYPDKYSQILKPNKDNGTAVNFRELIRASDNAKDNKVNMPLWISYNTDDQGILFVKVIITLKTNDLITSASALVWLCVFALVLLFVMLINSINSIIAQRHLIKMFFTDTVTGKRNKTWFIAKGEQDLRSNFNKKKRYAVISIEFVKYLNFCICHSISEGEKLLCRVSDALSSKIRKKDICVHYDSSDFAVLAEVSDETAMKQLVDSLLGAVTSATAEYDASFHIGAYMIDVQKNNSGKLIRKKYIRAPLKTL